LAVAGVRVGVANFFLDQSIGIDETNTIQLKFWAPQVWAFAGVRVGVAYSRNKLALILSNEPSLSVYIAY